MIDAELGTKEKRDEWQEAIEILQMLLDDTSSQKMQLGCIVQSYVSPALLQFDLGGMVDSFQSPLPQTGGFGGAAAITFKEGGSIGFEGLAQKLAKKYKGKKVKPKYQDEYGKTYSKEEAMEVGNKIAAKVYRQQQSK